MEEIPSPVSWGGEWVVSEPCLFRIICECRDILEMHVDMRVVLQLCQDILLSGVLQLDQFLDTLPTLMPLRTGGHLVNPHARVPNPNTRL
jgi:hypothetical protein